VLRFQAEPRVLLVFRPALARYCSVQEVVIVWQDDTDDDGNDDVVARAFRADGSQWKAQWAVSRNTAGQQLDPGAALAPGTVVSAWQDDTDANGTYQILADGLELP
jgi:hypothetical protein